MLNHDDILQKKLDELESGIPLETVLQDLPAEAKELEDLIRLAATVRTLPHPEPAVNQVAVQRQQVMAAAVRHTQPRPHLSPAAKKYHPAWKWIGAGSLVGMAAGLMVLFAFMVIGVGMWLSGRDISAARVENVTGQVQVATNSSGTQWKNIEVGGRLHRGDRLRTLGASSATLVFFEGTHTFVSANSVLTFTELKGSSGNTLQVKIDQKTGETWNKVTPFKGNTKSFFLVQTPSGTASVHGTNFNVKVAETGQVQFSVDTGVVKVNNNGNEVTLQAGQVTTANTSGEITTPTYQFSVQGAIMAMDPATGLWTVSGVQFKVNDVTNITGTPQIGDTVKVDGRILEDGTWVADTIEPVSDDSQQANFTGILEVNEGELWQISGKPVKVNPETQLDSDLKVGDPVKVTYNLLDDGTWLALKIESLVEEPDRTTPTPTATSDPRAMPSYEFAPDEIEMQGCGGSSFNLTGSLRNTANDPKDYAANVELGYLIDRGGEYVNSVELTPSYWARIDAGQTVTFDIHVTMNDRWATLTGKGGDDEDNQVKLRIFVASATNRPDHLNGRLTVTIEAGCKATPTPTITGTVTEVPSETLTPGITGTPTITPTAGTPTPVSTQADQCTGAKPHPTGMKLAQRYGVPYEEIMKWFCQHYGFGEIDLAYSLSRQSGKPVEEIFAMRASGMGWGEIKKALAPSTKDKNPPGDKDNGKGGKKDK